MKMQALTLKTSRLTDIRPFYADTLEFPVVAETPGSLTFQTGKTQLTFEQDEQFTGFYHFAFDIPRNQVDAAQAWLEARVPLLPDTEGTLRFLPNPNWNTTNLYFADPAGNVLEFIARHDMNNDAMTGFASVLHVSELGVVVPDVPQAVHEFSTVHGLHPFNGQSDTFTAVGGHDGMLIVVPVGRGWFPIGKPAVRAPFQLHCVNPSGVNPSGEIQRLQENERGHHHADH